MVEIKLSIAREEGCSAKGLGEPTGRLAISRVMPGLYVLSAPADGANVPFVVLTDDFDLSLLGFEMGDNSAAILLHDDDRKIIESQGFSVAADKFEAFPSAAGWHLAAFPWNDLAAIDQALGMIFPHYHPTGLPGSIPLDR